MYTEVKTSTHTVGLRMLIVDRRSKTKSFMKLLCNVPPFEAASILNASPNGPQPTDPWGNPRPLKYHHHEYAVVTLTRAGYKPLSFVSGHELLSTWTQLLSESSISLCEPCRNFRVLSRSIGSLFVAYRKYSEAVL